MGNADLLGASFGEYTIPSVGPGYVTVRRGGMFDNSAPQVRLQIPNEQQTLERVKEAVANTDMDAALSGDGSSGGGGSPGGGGSSGGGGGGGGSNEPSGSPDVRINSFGLSPGFPDQQPPLPAGSNISFEIELENRGTKDKFQQDFTVTALGETLTSASLTSPTSTPTLRNIRVPIPQVSSERPVEFCAKLSDKSETECVTYRVTPDFDPDAVEVTQIVVPSQIRIGDDLTGTIRVDNPNPNTAQVRWRVDFGGGTVTDDGVTRVPGEKVVEIPYSGRAPEYDGQFEVCGRLDSVTPR